MVKVLLSMGTMRLALAALVSSAADVTELNLSAWMSLPLCGKSQRLGLAVARGPDEDHCHD